MNSRNLFILLLIFQFNLKVFAQVPTSGLVGYFPFNGNANDLSGSANNGVVNGAVLVEDRFGNPNSAYYFDGVNDYIKISGAEELRNPTYTYSYWVKVASYPSSESAGAMLEFGSVPAQPKYGITVSLNNNYLTSQGWIYTSGSTNFTWISTKNTALPSLARWYHVLVSRNDKMNVWVDGELVSTSSVDGLTQYYTTPLDGYIGTRAQVWQFFNGVIDDIRIYDHVLNADEVSALYHEGICKEKITVTDALIINLPVIASFNPVTFKNTIKIYPNPTDASITINYGSNFSTMAGYTMKISNAQGQIVYSGQVNQEEAIVDLSSWGGPGIYLVQVLDGGNNIKETRKIVLQ